MKEKIYTLIFTLFLLMPFFSQVYADSPLIDILPSEFYTCGSCTCDDKGVCSCKKCDYFTDNSSLAYILSGADCSCNQCYYSDNHTSVYSKLFNLSCVECSCDNETVRHLKELFINAKDFSVCDNRTKLVKFPEDTYLEKCIREYTGFTRWPISCASAEKVTMLKCNDPYITSLDGIEQFVNLTHLDMGEQGTKIKDLKPLRNLRQLKRIEIPNSEITNVEFLTRLPYLKYLNLSGNHITDLTYFPYINPLDQLALNYQGPDYIKDISPLKYISTSLQYLSLQGNKISDISPLSHLYGLKYLSIRDNRITSIKALDNKSILSGLDMSINLIKDITPLANNRMLNVIIADHNLLSSIEPVRYIPKLAQVSFKHNFITDVSPVADMPFMKSMAFDFNKITDVTPIQDITIISYILSLRFTYNCIPKDNYKKIRFLYNVQDVHFENQCESYPPDNVFIDGENIVNVDIVKGEVYNPGDNTTSEDKEELPKKDGVGAGCSISKGKNTASDIVIITALLLLFYKILKHIKRKYNTTNKL